MRHKHADLIIAWANGAEIQKQVIRSNYWHWIDDPDPTWHEDNIYRKKPEPKPDEIMDILYHGQYWHNDGPGPNLRLTFDGETGKLKDAKVLK